MKLVSALLALALASTTTPGSAPAQNSDTLAYMRRAVELRAQPTDTARVVGRLAAGAAVRRYACSDGWCNVARRGATGYVPDSTLQPASTALTKGYVNSQGQWVPSPTRTPDNSPPAGATAQCRDGTYSFSRSRRGTCSHHGGVSRWL